MLVLSASFAVAVVGAFVVLVLAIGAQRSAGRTALRAEKAIAAGRALESAALNLDNGVRGYVITGRRRSLEPFRAGRRAYPTRLAALRGVLSGSREERALLERIDVGIHDYVDFWGMPLILIAEERLETARSVIRNTIGRERIDALRGEFGALFARERTIAQVRQQRAEHRSDVSLVLGGAGVVLALALGAGLALYLRREVVRPLGTLATATEAVAGGDLGTRVPVERDDEIGTLERGFNAMTSSLQARTAELERSNRDLQDFAAVASHDLQGPLVTISKLATLLSREADDAGRQAELAGHIAASTMRLNDLVGDLLAYAKVGQGELRRRAVALDDVVHEALDNLDGPITAAGAHVITEPLPSVQGDPRRLCQLVQNLLANAVKFTNGGPPVVRITAQSRDGWCRLSIADNGVGFTREEAGRIFRPFHRLHPIDRYEGSGIGLAICERIVAQHGGRIWAEGREGEGATFHVELPLATDFE
jgi:signal transduction histidine kinase